MKPFSVACVVGILCLTSFGSDASAARAALDHLVPVEKEQGSGAAYETLWRQKLLVTPGDVARFVGLPGNVGEETSVSVYRRMGKSSSNAAGYWITATQASSRIWNSISGPGVKRPISPRTISVRRFDAPLPESTALAIHRVWIAMLSQTRPEPKSESIAIDNSTEIFSAMNADGRLLQGQLSSEPGKSSLALLELGFSLMEYCDTPVSRRRDKARQIEKAASELLMQLQSKK